MTDNEHPKSTIARLIRNSDPAHNVADFATAARKRGRKVAAPAPPPAIQITGNNNTGVVGNHNHIEIKVSGTRRSLRPIIQPGPEHITDTQAAEIHELVVKVVTVSGKPFPFVWKTIKKAFRFEAYRLMSRDKYEDVRQYLRKWIASSEATQGKRNAATPSADRKRLLARIHAEARKQKGLLDKVKAYAYARFEVQSLGNLSSDELGELIRQFSL